jgi:ceramide glucosyltransferase
MTETLFLGAVTFAAAYALVALACVVAFARRRPTTSRLCPPVTILKPLRGDDGQLYENLLSFCRQDYPRFEIVFGVRDADDPAVTVVRRLQAEFRDLRLRLVIDDRVIGTNLKVSNLANMVRHARHDTLVVADSDMRVGPDYLRAVVGPLEEPGVGLVTCLYRGVAPCGMPSRLGAMFINEWFLPAALVGIRIEGLRHAFGATIACRRQTLRAIGGFEALADQLADDYMLGWLVSDLGFRVALAPYVVNTVITERDLRGLFLHELRWARTFRTLRPLPYFGSLLTYGIPLSALWLVTSSGGRAAWLAAIVHLGLRCGGRLVLHQSLGEWRPWWETWLVPLRDVLSFTVGLFSFVGRRVQWNDETLEVRRDGRLERATETAVRAPLDAPAKAAPLVPERQEPV